MLSYQRIGVSALLLAVLVYAPHGNQDLAAPRAIGDGNGAGMLYPMLLQQEKDLFPALPRNLLIFFLVLSFAIPVAKYVFRLIRAQVEELLAAANQDGEEEELME